MRKNPTSESALFHPRVLLALLFCVFASFMAIVSFAATPDHGTLTDTNSITYTAGPFFQANQSPVFEVDSGPRCDQAAFPCDIFKLTLKLPAGYAAAHPKAVIRLVATWTDPGTKQSTYGVYMFKTPRSDCDPHDCSAPDGSQQADAQAVNTIPPGGSPNPQFVYMAITQDTATYTVMIIPNVPQGETVTVKMEVLPGSPGALTAGFGGPDPTTPGVPRYMNFYAPPGTSAQNSVQGEFNIGYNPATGRIMTMNSGPIWRITPAELLKPALPECCEGLWEDKSNPTTNTGLDPILWTDQPTGRTFISNSTAGANGEYAFSDDDGDNWTPVDAAPPNGGADHETIGTGPYPASVPLGNDAVNHGRAVYYCSQDVVGPASCQRSDDFGASYGPGVLAYNGQGPTVPNGSCGGLHGHLHVAPDGTVWLPVNQCANTDGPHTQGGAFSTDAGTTWNEFKVPNALSQPQGADPSIAIDADSTIYYSYVKNEPVPNGHPPEGHAHVAVGKLDAAKGTIKWLSDTDIGATHGIKNAAEIEAVGGSSGRAAVGFLGTDLTGDYQQLSFPGQWYAFIATTYDQGKTWVTVNATPNDPVQNHTGVWQQGGAQTDRNLLDFNEITIDKKGRVLYGYSDGCVTTGCIAGIAPNDFVAYMRVARQTGGKSLFASFDANTDTSAPILPKAPCLSGTRDAAGSHLTWKVPDNGGSKITDYYVYRATTAGGYDFLSPLGHTGGATVFNDASADPTVKHYFYVVKAVTTVGSGAASNEVDLKIAPVGPVENVCSLAGLTVLTDDSGDSTGPPGTDLLSAHLSQPYANGGAVKFVFTIDTDPNPVGTVPPNSGWYLAMKVADPSNSSGFRYTGVRMDGTASGPTFSSYVPAGNLSGNVDGRFVASKKPADPASHYDAANGKITIVVKASDLGFVPGTHVSGFVSGTTQTTAVGICTPVTCTPGLPSATEVYDSMPNSLGFTGSYVVDANAVCGPNLPPVAQLRVVPDHGPAPLTVTLDGSASADPDHGDRVASYTFDFGDGSAPVTQASPTITHTYNAAGEYPARLSVKDSHGKGSTNIAIAVVEVDAVLRNISTRGNVQTGDDVLIGGFIVTGNQPRKIVLRAIGPSIESGGKPLPGTLQDPTLELHDSAGLLIAKNDDWKKDGITGQSQQTAIEGTGVPPKDDRESAIVRTLNPGKYTAIVRGKGNTTGLALVEAYDLNPFATSKLANISTRSFVGTGNNVMIGGFVAGPENAAPTTVLIRGLGPSLAAQHVPNPLLDPTLELHDSNGNKVRVNDNWQDSQQAQIQATGIPPSDKRESAIVTDIAPGHYTAILAGKGGTTGNGLVEIYNID